jgi:hypothetical protein
MGHSLYDPCSGERISFGRFLRNEQQILTRKKQWLPPSKKKKRGKGLPNEPR